MIKTVFYTMPKHVCFFFCVGQPIKSCFIPLLQRTNWTVRRYIDPPLRSLVCENQKIFSSFKTKVISQSIHFKKNFNCSSSVKNINFLNDFWKRPRKKHGQYALVQPGLVSEAGEIPPDIVCPEYAYSGIVDLAAPSIEIKDLEVIQKMKDSCALARNILDHAGSCLKIGMTTEEVDQMVHTAAIAHKAYPSPLNYHGFPKSVCTSVNNVACHGIPDDRPLEDGDIISIDVSVFYNGYHGDCARTFGIGDVDGKGKKLMHVAQNCLNAAVTVCGPEQKFSEIGRIISETAEVGGCTVVPEFCGHGIGKFFHGPPDVFHFVNQSDGIMQEGMTFTIEPVISEGEPKIVILEDGWTAVTLDNSRCAQFEHTILVTKTGVEVLTSSSIEEYNTT
ncbi:methionine aminopeptidase 1D, mitochondrial-like [Limulus polyphemus]|uniref:Methionine aminopeptidase n=1 Tax=Limulus polyphemus TaxID=6850 RepID=A0ABM1S562_LIMPO|nr:methionine aminopeptidase 1D, mitochondrial-like [Limulus polyphemus]XP_013772073.1 methionine aminopeptidase 1D, mitochondrial-like [Limulus polyphemus]XP_013772074.1 methionine aminopeptidase 1D, mitochondrial-like [Limulus polyphemus]XP_022238766.1 methionine aminopeptidase 1D, mitochondrial-like [Limulus polyphemus]XP_022238767.1 methionine aminopeptidase 1D, mitochondrial-like [Limulus polyphemus]